MNKSKTQTTWLVEKVWWCHRHKAQMQNEQCWLAWPDDICNPQERLLIHVPGDPLRLDDNR